MLYTRSPPGSVGRRAGCVSFFAGRAMETTRIDGGGGRLRSAQRITTRAIGTNSNAHVSEKKYYIHGVLNEVYLQIFLGMAVTFRNESNDGN